MTSCCWDLRHELLGVVLLVIATFLTIITCNGFGIAAMFVIGGMLCGCKHWCCRCHKDMSCHSEEGHGMMCMDKEEKQPAKKSVAKAKK